jgi:predicted nucleic acid-binding protein
VNLYLDASALVKLYVEEAGRAAVLAAISKAEIVGTAIIAYVEARAAFARRRREGALARPGYLRCVRDLDQDWPRYLRFELNEPLVFTAARMTDRYRLRAYDAVHLASAVSMRDRLGDVIFACWDKDLNAAARRMGLVLVSV